MSYDEKRGAADPSGAGDTSLASDVSDYVSGRLDPLAEQEFGRRLARDRQLAEAVTHALLVRHRVERRLRGRQRGWN